MPRIPPDKFVRKGFAADFYDRSVASLVERFEDTETAIVQAILESTVRDVSVPESIAEELREFDWIQSVEWAETSAEAE